MCGKNKCIFVFLVGMLLLCLLSACTVKGSDVDMESQQEKDSVEHELSSETLPSGTDNTGQQATENTDDEYSNNATNKTDKDISSEMEEKYKAILLGNEDFINIDLRDGDRKLNIENIKEVVSDEDWVTARVTKFTIIDLDGNGENEIVLWIEANSDLHYGFEILYSQGQEVYGFTLPYRAFTDIKTDGTFYYSGGMNDQGIGRLQFSEREYTIEDASDSGSQEGKTSVVWYELTPESVELAFENMF